MDGKITFPILIAAEKYHEDDLYRVNTTIMIKAANSDEAMGIAQRSCMKRFPVMDGWKRHFFDVGCTDIINVDQIIPYRFT